MSFLDNLIATGSMNAVLQASTAAIGKLAANIGVNIGTVDIAAPSTATVVTVPASASVVTLQAANVNRVGLIIANNKTSTSTLCVKFGTAASLSSWSVQIEPGGTYEMPRRYCTGIVTGIWSNATGDAHVTETG